MEWLLALLLAGVLAGVPGAWRGLAVGVLGPIVAVVTIVAIARTDWGTTAWWLAALAAALAVGVAVDARRARQRSARGEPPQAGWPYDRITRR